MTYKLFTLKDVKAALRQGEFAFPGGYPLYFIAGDSEALSFDAVRQQWHEVCRAMLQNHNPRDQWRIIGCDINYEDEDLYCAHTNKRIPSAYGEDESE